MAENNTPEHRETGTGDLMAKPTSFRVRMAQRFSFPADMLRYDACYPASSDDAIALSVAMRVNTREWTDAYVSAGITSIRLTGAQCTPDRWRSFGWEVVNG